MSGKIQCRYCKGTGKNELKERCGVCGGKGSYCEHEWVYKSSRKSTFKDGEKCCGNVDTYKCKHCGEIDTRLLD